MDLHFTADVADPEETEAVDARLATLPPEGDRRQYLLPVLHAIQDRRGWISPGALNYACRRLEVPPAEAFGVADFYALFQTRPHPPVTVHVCDDIACRTRGGGGALRRGRGDARPPGDEPGRPRHLAPQPLPRPLRARAGGARGGGRRARRATAGLGSGYGRRHPHRRCWARRSPQPDLARSVPQMGQPGLKLLAPRRPGRSHRASTTTAPPAASSPCAAPSRWAPRRWCKRSPRPSSWAAAAPPFPPGGNGRGRARRRCRAT